MAAPLLARLADIFTPTHPYDVLSCRRWKSQTAVRATLELGVDPTLISIARRNCKCDRVHRSTTVIRIAHGTIEISRHDRVPTVIARGCHIATASINR